MKKAILLCLFLISFQFLLAQTTINPGTGGTSGSGSPVRINGTPPIIPYVPFGGSSGQEPLQVKGTSVTAGNAYGTHQDVEVAKFNVGIIPTDPGNTGAYGNYGWFLNMGHGNGFAYDFGLGYDNQHDPTGININGNGNRISGLYLGSPYTYNIYSQSPHGHGSAKRYFYLCTQGALEGNLGIGLDRPQARTHIAALDTTSSTLLMLETNRGNITYGNLTFRNNPAPIGTNGGPGALNMDASVSFESTPLTGIGGLRMAPHWTAAQGLYVATHGAGRVGNTAVGNANAPLSITGGSINNPQQALDVFGQARIRRVINANDDQILCWDNATGDVHWRSAQSICSACPGGGNVCTWNTSPLGIQSGPDPSDADLVMGYGGACKKGRVGIGTDIVNVGTLPLLPGTSYKLLVNNIDRTRAVGTFSMAGARRQSVGVVGYSVNDAEVVQSVGVYGLVNQRCVTGASLNAGVYGGTTTGGAPNCPGGPSYGGYFAAQLVGTQFTVFVSDQTLKREVNDLNSEEVDRILRNLSPKSFYYDKEVEPGFSFNGKKKEYGFIAQEVERVFPDIVQEIPGPIRSDESGGTDEENTKTYKGITYESLIAVLVKKVQDLQVQIDRCCSRERTAGAAENSSQPVMLGDKGKQEIVLNQNVPNPFSDKTTIAYSIPSTSKDAEMKFYDANGYLIKSVQLLNKGNASVDVYSAGIASGIYTYVLYVDGRVIANKKMVKS